MAAYGDQVRTDDMSRSKSGQLMPTTNRLSGDLRSAVCSWCKRTAKGAVAFVVTRMSVLEPRTKEDLQKDMATLTAAVKGALSLL